MKKISLLLVCWYLLSMAMCFAKYPKYLNGDRNRPLIWGHMDDGWFLDKTSIKCEKYEPPCYTLTANFFVVHDANRGNKQVSKIVPMRWFYNYQGLAMYNDQPYGTLNWKYMNPTGSNAEAGLPMYAGEAVFYINYSLKFYGSKKWYNKSLQKNIEVFSNEFYSKF